MGHLAQAVAEARAHQPQGGAGKSFHGRFTRQFTLNGEDGDGDGPAGGQAEVSIAVERMRASQLDSPATKQIDIARRRRVRGNMC